jgi:hypothetical protein
MMLSMTAQEPSLSIVPANQASCEDLRALSGTRGVSRALAAAAVAFARERGARAIEGYRRDF